MTGHFFVTRIFGLERAELLAAQIPATLTAAAHCAAGSWPRWSPLPRRPGSGPSGRGSSRRTPPAWPCTGGPGFRVVGIRERTD